MEQIHQYFCVSHIRSQQCHTLCSEFAKIPKSVIKHQRFNTQTFLIIFPRQNYTCMWQGVGSIQKTLRLEFTTQLLPRFLPQFAVWMC